ncbi:ring finger protein-like [Elgaria multicarinata webbii]|uniref:ring finger protein-like n=1 Tax=Elgaria multicarinata webbii TaxID=159646 RepID=UPI002FCD606C
MGMTPADSERAPMVEQRPLALDLEQPEAASLWDASPPGTLGQEAALWRNWTHSKPPAMGTEEEDAGREHDAGGACLPPHRGLHLDDRPVSSGSPEEEEEEPSYPEPANSEEGTPGESSVDPAESLELPQLPSRAKEEVGEVVLATGESSLRTAPGQELLLTEGDPDGAECLCLLERKGLAPEGSQQEAPESSCCIQAEGSSSSEQECPICTEVYDGARRRPALLNCGHTLCGQCLHAIMEAASAADIGRVRCPICRQKTPMMEWEICKLQEELLLLSATPGPCLGPPAFQSLPARRPGFWGGLEHRFQVRFLTSRMMGFLPCLRYPPCLIGGLARLQRRCPWGYRLALLLLLGAEMLSLLLVFLPIVLLLLLFLILDK